MAHSDNTRDQKAFLIGGLLIFLVGGYFIGKNLFFNDEPADEVSDPLAIVDKKEGVPFMTPEVLLKKMQNGDALMLVDMRDEASFQGEHIARSLSLPISMLGTLSPAQDEALVIIVPENDPAVFETAKNIMSQKSFPYFFLEGGLKGWRDASAPLVSLGDPDSFVDQSKVTFVTLEIYKQAGGQNNSAITLIDVQSEADFKARHLKGALNIPLSQLEKRVGEIPAGRQIAVYGKDDTESFQAGVRLFDLGIFSARTFIGNNLFIPESGLILEP